MPLNKSIKHPVKKPMTDEQLADWEASRDLEAELVESVRQMKRHEGAVVYSPVIAARQNSKLSQAQFAQLLGVSVRTLQGWEQGRKQPSGAARTLITLAQRTPEALRDLVRT
ncbi:MAG: helix-turn-helix domain-containing protein [Rhodoferax sp.]